MAVQILIRQKVSEEVTSKRSIKKEKEKKDENNTKTMAAQIPPSQMKFR